MLVRAWPAHCVCGYRTNALDAKAEPPSAAAIDMTCRHRQPTERLFDCGCGGKVPIYHCGLQEADVLIRAGRRWTGGNCFACLQGLPQPHAGGSA